MPTPAYRRFDAALAVTALLADLWIISLVVVFGSDASSPVAGWAPPA
ncbi:hypothetical protein ACFYZ2_25425 [Streptomyces sviceus]